MSNGATYTVTLTDDGTWMHAPGSDFLFAFIDKSWDSQTQAEVKTAFENALKMPTIIKAAVKETAGQDVVNGLYLLDAADMTKAMNSIPGMGATSTNQVNEKGSGTAVSINAEFFKSVLAGLSGDIAPMMTYLVDEMQDLQAQIKQSTVTDVFGSVMGLISVMPELDVVVTSFVYVFSSKTTSDWMVKVNCGSAENYSYDYTYDVAVYEYDPTGRAGKRSA